MMMMSYSISPRVAMIEKSLEKLTAAPTDDNVLVIGSTRWVMSTSNYFHSMMLKTTTTTTTMRYHPRPLETPSLLP